MHARKCLSLPAMLLFPVAFSLINDSFVLKATPEEEEEEDEEEEEEEEEERLFRRWRVALECSERVSGCVDEEAMRQCSRRLPSGNSSPLNLSRTSFTSCA